MPTLPEILCDPSRRPAVVSDCVQLIEEEVSRKSGVSGLAIKAGFKAVRAVKPTAIREAMDGLLDEFAEHMDPFFQSFLQAGAEGSFDAYMKPRSDEAANALLAITDRRADRHTNKKLVKGYQKLRPMAQRNVSDAIPAVARVVDKHRTQI